MREIKFRAMDKKHKVMFTQENHEELCAMLNAIETYEDYDSCADFFYKDEWYPALGMKGIFDYFQDVATSEYFDVMQYTGLKDKNGKEIYEGDIVKTNEGNWIAKVIFSNGMFMCEDNQGGFSAYCDWKEFEVLGNIYENSELLEEMK